jgi:hypothetical protein
MLYVQDNMSLIIVFVSSEGQGQDVLMTQSSRSRMDSLEISDLSDDEVWEFLKFALGPNITEERRNELTQVIEDVTGGRILNLKKVVGAIMDNVTSLQQVCEAILNNAEKDFKKAGMINGSVGWYWFWYGNDPQYDKFWTITKQLISKQSISDIEARGLLGRVLYDELRKSNVFAFHESTNMITFQSKAHETVAKQLLSKQRK